MFDDAIASVHKKGGHDINNIIQPIPNERGATHSTTHGNISFDHSTIFIDDPNPLKLEGMGEREEEEKGKKKRRRRIGLRREKEGANCFLSEREFSFFAVPKHTFIGFGGKHLKRKTEKEKLFRYLKHQFNVFCVFEKT